MQPRRSKVKLSLIANKTIRRATFRKRKRGIMKKLYELTSLCDVKACAVVYSPYEPVPEVWPSTEGVEEVASKFMELPITERFKNMMDQETYLHERIVKEQGQVKKLCGENRESQLRQFMFDCVEGKMNEHQCDPRDLQDLSFYIHHYIDQLHCRIKYLTESSESSSFPPFPTAFAGAAEVTAPIGVYDQFQYQIMNMNHNQHEPVQHHVQDDFYDQIQYHNMNMNQNQHEPVQYKAPVDFNDQIQHGIYDMNLNQNMNYDLNHNLSLNLNQYPYQQESFMNLLVEHPLQMGYVGEHAQIPFMDGHYNYHQLPTADLVNTGHMPSITTAAAAGVYAPYINNTL